MSFKRKPIRKVSTVKYTLFCVEIRRDARHKIWLLLRRQTIVEEDKSRSLGETIGAASVRVTSHPEMT